MTIDEIDSFVKRYAKELGVLRITLYNGKILIAILVHSRHYEDMRAFNVWPFIRVADAVKWRNTGDITLCEVIDGEIVADITTLI